MPFRGGVEEDTLRIPLGQPSSEDSPRTSCIKENLYHVTSIPIEQCLSQIEQTNAGSNNRSGFRGVRQVSKTKIANTAQVSSSDN